jgi:hypothetical protein
MMHPYAMRTFGGFTIGAYLSKGNSVLIAHVYLGWWCVGVDWSWS